MTWFKVDDAFAVHPKALAAGNEALGLWVRAGSWCAQQLTDGFLPRSMVKVLGSSDRFATKLVAVGLWEATEDGYWFHSWHDYQPTRESVEQDRKAAAQRQQRARDRAKESRRDEAVTHAVTSDEVTRESRESASHPSRSPRPDPTRPIELPTGSSVARKRAAQLSDDWKPNDAHRRVAAEEHVNLDREAVRFRDYYQATGKAMKDWDAAFRNWLRRSRDKEPPSNDRSWLDWDGTTP